MILKNISGDSDVFNTLPDDNEKITYDIMMMTRNGAPHVLLSDGATCIVAQTGPKYPMWIYLRSQPDKIPVKELTEIISAAVETNPGLHVISDRHLIKGILDSVGKPYRIYMEMNSYACRKPISIEPSGSMIPASEAYRADTKRLLAEMIRDSVNKEADEAETDGFADYAISSGNVFLWNDGDKIASMANIASRTAETARINTIVTERDLRGRGYAVMLVTELCKKLLSEGLTPMLYADAANPSSNRAYRKAGFELTGTVCEFAFTAECVAGNE